MSDSQADPKPRVFLSHSSKDKAFVRKLHADLESAGLNVWIDERELAVGDSIVAGIDEGLRDTDYLVVVLSPSSVASNWVQAELNAGLMSELSEAGTVVLPVLLADCDVPPLISDRVYADFRHAYDAGLKRLLGALQLEMAPIKASMTTAAAGGACEDALGALPAAKLRRRLKKRLSRDEVAEAWFDTFDGERMNDEKGNAGKGECVIDLIDRANREGKFDDLLGHLCENRPDITRP